MDLATISAITVIIGLVLYVFLDGFDLGIGLLFPFVKTEENRDKMMSTIAPVWDGNETWIVYTGGLLFALFPIAYATVLPALYIPATMLLVGLALRGVSFEFRLKAKNTKLWSFVFFLGSWIASMTQGIMLGALVSGIPIDEQGNYAGSAFTWLSVDSLLVGLSVCVAYIMMGLGWLIYKTNDDLQLWAKRVLKVVSVQMMFLFAVAFVVIKAHSPYVIDLLKSNTIVMWLCVALHIVSLAFLVILSVKKNWSRDFLPLLCVFGVFAVSLVSVVLVFWPYVIFPHYTIYNMLNRPNSVKLTLIVVGVMLPVVLGYTAYVYYVFRLKVSHANKNVFYGLSKH